MFRNDKDTDKEVLKIIQQIFPGIDFQKVGPVQDKDGVRTSNYVQVVGQAPVQMSIRNDPNDFTPYHGLTPPKPDLQPKSCKVEKNNSFHSVNKPFHYNNNRLGIECIQAMEASMTQEEFLGYLKGAAFKYLWRYRYKNNPIEDLQKATWYLNLLKEKYGAFKDAKA